MNVKALLFDLDDTLLDYSGGVNRSWTEACTACCAPAGIDPATLVAAIAETRDGSGTIRGATAASA